MENNDKLYKLRHSMAHILAKAVVELYGKEVKLAIGPPIDNGFYYDFDLDATLSENEFDKIDAKMREIIARNEDFVRKEISKAEAKKLFKDQPYKLELIEDLQDGEISIYYTGEDFVDLCRGEHVENSKFLRSFAFQLNRVSGAYWRGSEKNKMLQRVYVYGFEKPAELKAYLKQMQEALERDHRKLGKELDLFMLSKEVGSGLPFWLPKGAAIRREIERYITDKELELGYLHVYTPILANVDLYKTSGHWDHYKDSMFPPMDLGDGEMLVVRPMNCPHHMMIYKNEMHSYRDLPLRIAELGMMHRYEKSGQLSGLQRVREMTLNDAHIFVRPDQIKEEFSRTVHLILDVYKDFDIKNYSFRLSYRDPNNKEKYFDDDEMWNNAEKMIKETMDDLALDYEEAIGEAAFYGPKLDIQVKTAVGNEETLSTIQLDFLLPRRFDLTYVDENGNNDARPVVIHRGVVSTMERFVAYLIEEYKGKFPLWLSPIQVRVLNISDNSLAYAEKIHKDLMAMGVRSELDGRNEKIGKKIREAQVKKVNYMLVVGDKEMESEQVSVRHRSLGDQGVMPAETFKLQIINDIARKVNSL